MLIKRGNVGFNGITEVPGDKSVSHRAVMFGALADGKTSIEGFLPGEDCLSTIECFRNMGVNIEQKGSEVIVYGVGLHGLKAPNNQLYVGNSGTSIRLLLGILAGQRFPAIITGDASIVRRPMRRVVEPLRCMGADITGEVNDDYAPLKVQPTAELKGITYHLPIASAQVKSAILLAGLYAKGTTTVIEPAASRDHTEIMLKAFGARIVKSELTASIEGDVGLTGRHITVPGDISSAAFLIVAALIVPGSDITIKNVGMNPTRTGIIDVLKAMGGNIETEDVGEDNIEPMANIHVRYSCLKGVEIAGEIIPRLIDEIPIIAIAAAFASGKTVIRDAAELKVKESNRIKAMVDGLVSMGAKVQELSDGMIIYGDSSLNGTTIDSQGDHRIAMAFAVAGLAADGCTEIANDSCIPVSFPGFAEIMRKLGAIVE